MDHEKRHLINLFTLYKSLIEHNIELLVTHSPLSFLLLNARANDMAAKTEKSYEAFTSDSTLFHHLSQSIRLEAFKERVLSLVKTFP